MTSLLFSLISLYRRINAALVTLRFPLVSFAGCRSVPTCSEYAIDSIRSRGPLVGTVVALARIGRCNPLLHVH